MKPVRMAWMIPVFYFLIIFLPVLALIVSICMVIPKSVWEYELF